MANLVDLLCQLSGEFRGRVKNQGPIPRLIKLLDTRLRERPERCLLPQGTTVYTNTALQVHCGLLYPPTLARVFLVFFRHLYYAEVSTLHSPKPAYSTQLTRPRVRIYGITLRNKMLVACFGTLSLAKLAMSLVAIFTSSPVVADSSPAPADAFGLCELVTNPRFGFVPCSIGTAFGT